MKFLKSGMPLDNNFNPSNGNWILCNKISKNSFFLIGCINAIVISVIMHIIKDMLSNSDSFNFFLSLLVMILIIMPIHEIIHALLFPEPLNSNNIFFGMMLNKGCFYTYYSGNIKKNRFLAIIIMPFLVLTAIPMILILFLGFNKYLFELANLNFLLCSMDILSFFLISFYVPNGATIRNKGYDTYYKF